MGKPGKEGDRRSLAGPSEGFGHNPFAGLTGGSGAVPRDSNAASEEAEPTIPATNLGPVNLRRERKGRGGKGVVVVEGLPLDQLKPLARAAAKTLGTGARVEGEALVIQGDQAERIAGWLEGLGLRIKRAN